MQANTSPTKTLNICVFTSASNRLDPKFMTLAQDLGSFLAKLGHTVVYGGANVGMMGCVADAALKKNGKVIGVFPENLGSREIAHSGLTQLVLTKDLHDRKKTMYDLADIFITLPGGFGTLDETFEVLTWNQLGHIKKPLYFFNHEQFFDKLLEFIKQLEHNKFIKVYDSVGINCFNNWEELTTIIKKTIEKKYA